MLFGLQLCQQAFNNAYAILRFFQMKWKLRNFGVVKFYISTADNRGRG